MKKVLEYAGLGLFLIAVIAIGNSVSTNDNLQSLGGGGAEARVNNLGSTFLSSNATSTSGDPRQQGLTILARNVDRNYAKICTTSNDIIYLSFTTTTQAHNAAQGEGMPISVTAGYSNCFVLDPSDMYLGIVYATSSDAGTADVITFIED